MFCCLAYSGIFKVAGAGAEDVILRWKNNQITLIAMKKEIVMKKEDSAGVLEKGWLDAGSRRIDEIIIHCSATPAGRDVRVADIRRWHVEERGWRDVGYHFVVCLDGRIERGRPLWKAGAHCMGHNSHSVGVCYVGGVDVEMRPADTRTQQQKVAMKQLVGLLRERFAGARVYGHCDFARKACPSFDVIGEEW